MKVKDYLAMAIPSDRLIVVKGKEELFRGYVALIDASLYDLEVVRIGVFPIITAKETGKPVKETNTFSCTDLDFKVFTRIETK